MVSMVDGKRAAESAATEPYLGGSDGDASGRPRDIADPDVEIEVLPADQRYETRATLGEGGMGEVRLCRDRLIGREVARKAVIASHAGRAQMRARFVREARVQGQLEHPSIVPVYDFGVDADGSPYFTMRRVRGVTLERVIELLALGDEQASRKYTRHKLLGAFVQACLAIDFAHERGVLHRDLKPSNIMLGDHGEVYVLDWGLAKVRSASRTLDPTPTSRRAAADATETDATETDSARSHAPVTGEERSAPTEAGAVLGTPGYMAPEQTRGEEVDAKTDIYALGAILFELLTLEPLHGTGTVAAMMRRAALGVDARPSVRAPERDVPPELETVCVVACAADRARRFASARDVADAVEAYLSGDRDSALRRELGRVHLARAREAAARAGVPSAPSEERQTALREVGRAIALAPDDAEALALFVELLTAPPKEPPAEVLEAAERAARASQRKMLPRVSLAYGGVWIVLLPLAVALGFRSVLLMVVPVALWVLAAILAWVAYRFDHTSRGTFPYVTVTAALALAASSLLHGPFMVVPSIGAVIAMGMALQTVRSNRVVATSMNLLAVVVPTLLAWAGLHPAAMDFVGGKLVLNPGALELPRDGTYAYMVTMQAIVIVVAAKYAGEYRDALTALEIKSLTREWQLGQLVPREAAAALTTPSVPPPPPDPALPGRK